MNSLLIKNASAVITCDSKDTVMEHANLLINNGVISYIGPEHRPQTKRWMHPDTSFIRDLSTRIIIFIRHSAGISLKYRIWNFSTGSPPYMKSGKSGSGCYLHSSITGMGELLKTGCTTCFDHHYVFPDGNSDALLDAQFSAAKDLGIRM